MKPGEAIVLVGYNNEEEQKLRHWANNRRQMHRGYADRAAEEGSGRERDKGGAEERKEIHIGNMHYRTNEEHAKNRAAHSTAPDRARNTKDTNSGQGNINGR